MNIKEAQKRTGISARNIRFYEQKGMLHPARNQDNDYRDYSQKDIERLKLIRALRMVDMPLEDIRNVLGGTATLGQALAVQEEQLNKKIQNAQIAIRFCRCLGELGGMAEVDTILEEMDRQENRKHLFFQWRQDYKKMCKFLHRATFTFVPDGPVTNAREFTQALLHFAWIPLVMILVAVLMVARSGGLSFLATPEGVAVAIVFPLAVGAMLYRSTLFYYNNKNK